MKNLRYIALQGCSADQATERRQGQIFPGYQDLRGTITPNASRSVGLVKWTSINFVMLMLGPENFLFVSLVGGLVSPFCPGAS